MLAKVGDIVEAAIAFDPKVRMVPPDIRGAAEALFDELDGAGVRYLLVGGVALLSFVEGRNTQDIDLIVDARDLARVAWTVEDRDRDFARASFRGLRVDLLLTQNPVFALVRDHFAGVATFGERRVPRATREGLIALKLYVLPSLYRQGKQARAALYETDILMLHQGAVVDDDALVAELAPHLAPADIAELRRILDEQRSRRRFGA